MSLEQISPQTLKMVSRYYYDYFVEKHEGPWTWEHDLEDVKVELIQIQGRSVLLPVGKENHSNIAVVRCIVSGNEQTLTIFLTDTTYYTGRNAGFVAVCDKIPGEDWYIAVVYHECMLADSRKIIGEEL